MECKLDMFQSHNHLKSLLEFEKYKMSVTVNA